MGYQYALHQQKKQLLREISEIRKRHESANATCRSLREECINASCTSGGRHHKPNRGEEEWLDKENHLQNLNSAFLSVDDIGNIIPKTHEAALVAAQAYLLTTQPALGDPREGMHQAAIKGLGLVGQKLQQELPKQDKTSHSPKQGRRSQRSQSPHKTLQPHRSKSPAKKKRGSRENDEHNIITQAQVNRSRYEWDKENYKDEETEMGASCFTHRVHRTQVPKGFKLPHD
jgi:hypothetical protein